MTYVLKNKWSARWLALVLFLLPTIVQAQDDAPYLSGRVNDYGHVLSDAKELSLEDKLRNYEDQTTHQIVVLTVESLNGQDIESYANEVFNTWTLGQEGDDNGALLVVAVNDRKMRIEVGYGLEGELTDTRCGRIIREVIVPHFKRGDFEVGIEAGLESMMEAGRGLEISALGSNSPSNSGGSGFAFWLVLAGIIIVVAIVIIYKKRKRYKPRISKKTGLPMARLDEEADDAHLTAGQRTEERIGSIDYDVWTSDDGEDIQIIPYKKWLSKYSTCPNCKYKTYYKHHNITLQYATYSLPGRGEKLYRCAHCKTERRSTYTIPRKTRSTTVGSGGGGGWSSGGGGFSGGGGSSGGGGASGSW